MNDDYLSMMGSMQGMTPEMMEKIKEQMMKRALLSGASSYLGARGRGVDPKFAIGQGVASGMQGYDSTMQQALQMQMQNKRYTDQQNRYKAQTDRQAMLDKRAAQDRKDRLDYQTKMMDMQQKRLNMQQGKYNLDRQQNEDAMQSMRTGITGGFEEGPLTPDQDMMMGLAQSGNPGLAMRMLRPDLFKSGSGIDYGSLLQPGGEHTPTQPTEPPPEPDDEEESRLAERKARQQRANSAITKSLMKKKAMEFLRGNPLDPFSTPNRFTITGQ